MFRNSFRIVGVKGEVPGYLPRGPVGNIIEWWTVKNPSCKEFSLESRRVESKSSHLWDGGKLFAIT